MSWSFSETRSLVIKAARGAGLPWGYAEEAGFAVEWLEARNAPGVEAMADYLMGVSESGIYKSDRCPIAHGAHLSDLGRWPASFPKSVHQPLLLTPFLALVADSDSLLLEWAGQKVLLNSNGISGGVQTGVADTGLFECSVRNDVVSTLSLYEALRVPENRRPFIEILTRLAHKTYAPATEASRLKGAGAGLDDND